MSAGNDVCGNDAIVVWGVDAQGMPMGLVDPALAAANVGAPPEGEGWRWDFGTERWMRLVPLAEIRERGFGEIDVAAGAARLRYLTSVPGQESTYLMKAQQAQQFLQERTSDVPPFVQAEAEALGCTAFHAAQSIDAVARTWSDEIAPAIERERRRGKLELAAATDTAAARAALDAALAALAAL